MNSMLHTLPHLLPIAEAFVAEHEKIILKRGEMEKGQASFPKEVSRSAMEGRTVVVEEQIGGALVELFVAGFV